jgi:hypothetical protein
MTKLRTIMFLPVEQGNYIGRLSGYLLNAHEAELPSEHLDVLIARHRLRAATKELERLQIMRSWLLTEGEVKGEWAQCAAAHDCYTDDPAGDGWRTEYLLARPYWLCSVACAWKWRKEQCAKIDRDFSRRIEITWEGGKKSELTTIGKGLHGAVGPAVRSL